MSEMVSKKIAPGLFRDRATLWRESCACFFFKETSMHPKNDSIITEDGQRLTINEGLITGAEDPGDGLAFETGNTLDENSGPGNEEQEKACSTNQGSKGPAKE